jgi:hypothetical protein
VTVLLGSGHKNSIAGGFLRHVGTLDAVAETEFQPSDDIVWWLRSLPTEMPPVPGDCLLEDVEMPEVGEEQEELARESPELEEESDVGTDAPSTHPLDLNTLYPMPVKEETPEWIQLGLTRDQHEAHMIGESLGRKEKKRAERRAVEAERVKKEEEAEAQRKAEKAMLDANIAAMMARAAKLELLLKPEPKEPEIPAGLLPDVDGFCIINGIYELVEDDELMDSSSGAQSEEKTESAPEMNTDT